MRDRLKRNRRLTRKQHRLRLVLCIAAGCVLFLCGAIPLLRYASDARRTAEEEKRFKELYYETQSPSPDMAAGAATPVPATPEPTAAPAPVTAFPASEAVSAPSPAAAPEPTAAPWPSNPQMAISPAMARLRKTNKDIIGWLAIPGMLEQPVVQRDNEYYLTRDAEKKHNTNGALFLDEYISLKERPNTYIIFGHNMKTGEMFGNLRMYENAAYYRRNALVDFNVLYEDGKYAIFSIADVDILNGLGHYVPFMQLGSMEPEERNSCIRQLQELSVIRSPLLVDADDQLLLLVTCTGNDNTRRVVAARRLREGETVESLEASLQRAVRRQ